MARNKLPREEKQGKIKKTTCNSRVILPFYLFENFMISILKLIMTDQLIFYDTQIRLLE